MSKRCFIFAAGVSALLTGCLIPHTSERSPQIRGQVVDSRTGEPISNAKVRWLEQSSPSDVTDLNGTFSLPESKNWHVLYWGHADVPNHGRHSRILFVTHSDYYPKGVNAFSYVTNRSLRTPELRSIFLEHLHE